MSYPIDIEIDLGRFGERFKNDEPCPLVNDPPALFVPSSLWEAHVLERIADL